MKKLLFTLFIACFAVVFANAQEAKKQTSFAWTKAALTEIGCDAEQIKQIAAIRKEAAEKRKKLGEDTAISDKEKKAEAKKILKESKQAMTAILTDEQNKKVEEINAKLKEEAKTAGN